MVPNDLLSNQLIYNVNSDASRILLKIAVKSCPDFDRLSMA